MINPRNVIGIILAGGLSSRMGGGDKGLLQVGGKSLLNHAQTRLRPQVASCALNANGDPQRFATELPVIADSIDGFAGPLAGVLAGMDFAVQSGATHIATVAADTPFFPHDLVEKLVAGMGENQIAMAVTPDPERGLARHPTFGLWPVDLREDLRQALKDGLRKVVQWTQPHGCANVRFTATPFDPFFNVNTPDDLEQAKRLFAEYVL